MSGCNPPLWPDSDGDSLDDEFGCNFKWEVSSESSDDDHPPSLVTIREDFEWIVTTEPGESPLCSICRLVLKTLRTSKDRVITTIPPEVRSQAGCHLCALFVRYSTRHCDAAERPEPEVFIVYEYEEVDLRQATLVLVKCELQKPLTPNTWYSTARLGCVPSTGESIPWVQKQC